MVLSGVSLSAREGEIVAVVGAVGAGKTTLLLAIAGEAEKLRGTVGVRGKIAYVEQRPFLIPGTLLENVLLGKERDEERLQRVIEASALELDVEQLPLGLDTLISEGGSNLSGGQRARVSLARALYADADVYLLDDPLSAVDARICKHIFEKAIKGFLKDKCVILVTHLDHVQNEADRIYDLKNGTLIERPNKTSEKCTKINEEKCELESLASEISVDLSNLEEEAKKEPKTSPGSITQDLDHQDLQAALPDDKQQATAQPVSSLDEGRGVTNISAKDLLKYFSFANSWATPILLFLFDLTIFTVSRAPLSVLGSESSPGGFAVRVRNCARVARRGRRPQARLLPRSHRLPPVLHRRQWIHPQQTGTRSDALTFPRQVFQITVNFHRGMTRALVRSPAAFFDANPPGSIKTRF